MSEMIDFFKLFVSMWLGQMLINGTSLTKSMYFMYYCS